MDLWTAVCAIVIAFVLGALLGAVVVYFAWQRIHDDTVAFFQKVHAESVEHWNAALEHLKAKG